MAEGIGPGEEAITFRAGNTPEGEAITGEMVPGTDTPFVFCLTVKGKSCPVSCPIFETARRFTEGLPVGAQVNPNLVRTRIVFGDAFDRNEDVDGVAKALAALNSCQRQSGLFRQTPQ